MLSFGIKGLGTNGTEPVLNFEFKVLGVYEDREKQIFIGWSGVKSKTIADSLIELIINIFKQDVKTWASFKDLDFGVPWFDDLKKGIENSKLGGIFCLTKENLKEPYIHWEAGQISMLSLPLLNSLKGKTRVYLYLIDVNYLDLKGLPLENYQACEAREEDTLKLMMEINRTLKEYEIEEQQIKNIFDRCWPIFKGKLCNINPPSCKFDLY